MLGRKNALGHKQTTEERDKKRQAMLKIWADPEQRKRRVASFYDPGYRAMRRRQRLRMRFPTKMTSIERLLYDEFKKRRLHFEMHKTMFGRFQPDFVFEDARLIVQADGDYWHSLPNRLVHDHAFNAAAAADGWSVWRFGEREIKMHPAACARAVARFVRDHSPKYVQQLPERSD